MKPISTTLIAVVASLTLSVTGCIFQREHPEATVSATTIDPKVAQSSYWLDQPAASHIAAKDFDALIAACQAVLKNTGFIVDRVDYREGVVTSLPLISKQVYELWRRDIATGHDLAQSTLGTVRRTVRFDIQKLEDGTFQASPKVLVERDSMIERRITSVDQYQLAFSLRLIDVNHETEETGMADVPPEYWYAIARDPAMEKQLADEIGTLLKR